MSTDSEAAPTSRQADAIRRAIDSHFENGIPPSELLDQLSSEAGRSELVDLLIAAAVPRNPDAPRWLHWLDGGAAPHLEDLPDDDEAEPCDAGIRHPRVREKQSVGRLAKEQSAKVNALDADIAKAEAKVAELKRKRDHADGVARAAVAYGLLDTLGRRMGRVFALGPAYTLMRAVSGHVVGGRAMEANGGAVREGAIASVYASRAAANVRDVLVDLVGDNDFERDLFEAIQAVTEKHAPRVPLIAEERREIRRRLAIAEVGDVVGAAEDQARGKSHGTTGALWDF